MYSSLTRRKYQIMERLFPEQIQSSPRNQRSIISSIPIYIKLALCILLIYYLNLFIGYRSMIWFEKSFEDEYHLTMTRIDVVKAEENAEDLYGPPKNYLSNRFLIENEYLCGRSADLATRRLPHLIIFIKSTIEHFQQRQAIRQTWANQNSLSKFDIRFAFILGTNVLNTSIKDEANKYGDIIQIDRIDNDFINSRMFDLFSLDKKKRNIFLLYLFEDKMIMMLRWIDNHCSTKSVRSSFIDLRKYVLFVNDDYYIDIERLMNYLEEIDSDSEMTTYERRIFTTGQFIEKSRPERFVNNRWYMSIVDYPYNEYPPYISTECFLMTRYSARLFYIGSKYTRLFPFDHVYLGLIAYSMSVQFIPNNHLFSTTFRARDMIITNESDVSSRWQRFLHRNNRENGQKKSICYRGYSGEKLIQLWNDIHQTNISLSFT